ncbi:GNAT family N-acetyltransferase [Blastococcus sp. SYSU DS0617]
MGEPSSRGRGLGAAMIAAAVARGFADHPDAGEVLVPVAAANEASWRALERAGGARYATGELTPDNPVDSRDHVVHRFGRPRR